MFSAITVEAEQALERKEARLLSLAFAFLTLSALTISLARLSDGEQLTTSLQHLIVLPVWAGSLWLIRRFTRRANPGRDPFLLPVAFLLIGWGLLIVWRVAPNLGARQTGWFLVGSLALLEVMRSPRSLGWLRRYRYLWLSAGIGLTALTLVLGTNPAGGEPRLWLGCCGIYLQPSEPLRLLLIAFVASYLADQLIVERAGGWARDLLPLMLAAGLSGLLLLAQRDLGTATLFLAVLAFMIYLAFGHAAVLVGALALLIAGGAIGSLSLDLVQTRLQAWINPWADPTGAGYQIVQSLMAISSGGLLGAGPGLGAPTSVPVVQSDFIFAAVVEEWGMVGGIAMIALFAVLVGRGLRTAARSKDPFPVLLAGGVSIAFALQVLLILGGVTRLLPITGVTLPLISYGGSSLVTSMIAVGFLLLLSKDRPGSLGTFSRQIGRSQNLITLGWIACALTLGWWGLYRADTLTARTDNPRRGLDSLSSPRGQILDRNGAPLAVSLGTRGSYQRKYFQTSATPVTGYDSAAYGQAGVESSMDDYLRGQAGANPLTIWSHKLLYGVPPPGANVRLTLAAELQRQAAELLGDRPGSVIVLDAFSGEILAMASSPSYDPNLLEDRWAELLLELDAPLLNRGTQARYQPGMALAPLLYAWGSSNGLLDPDQPAPDIQAALEVFDHQLACQRALPPGGQGTWSTALTYVCAGSFSRLGDRLQASGFDEAISAFGLAAAPQIRLVVAAAVERPTTEVQLAAIGQGELTVTPLQMARAYAALAAAGVRPALSIVNGVALRGEPWQELPPIADDVPVVSPSAAQLAIDAMHHHPENIIGYEASALSGRGPIAWFAGFNRAGMLTVVVLEQGSVGRARAIGLQLIRSAADLDLTSAGG